jgi:hypothetical protein
LAAVERRFPYRRDVSALRRPGPLVWLAVLTSTSYALARASGWPDSSDRLATPSIDLWSAVWAPVRGLLSGYDVYRDHGAYLQAFHVPYGASAHPPFVLLVLSPLSALPLPQAWALFMLVTIACIWAALWLLAAPATRRGQLVVAGAGVVLVCTGVGEFLLQVGQLTGIALLGLALAVRYPTGRRGVLGVLLLTVVPQTAVPMSILLARGRGRVLVRGWALAALLSVPPLVLVGINAGSVGAVAHSVVSTLRRPGQAAPSRVDVVGLLFGHDLLLAMLLLVTLTVVVVVRQIAIGSDDREKLLVAVTATTLLWYHRPYDLIIPGVVLAALLVRSRRLEHWAIAAMFAAGCVLSAGLTASWRDALTGTDGKPSWHLVTAAMPLVLMGALAISWLVRRLQNRSRPGGAVESVSPRRASSSPSTLCP